MKFLNLIYNLFIALIIGAVMQSVFGVDPKAVVLGFILLGVAYSLFTRSGRYRVRGAAFDTLVKEIWTDDIEEAILPDDSFLNKMVRTPAENILLDSKGMPRVVHIQQSGGAGEVVKNRQNVPAPTRKREDSDVIFLLNDYSTQPVLISYSEEKELNPKYRDSVLGEDKDAMANAVAENALLGIVTSPAYGANYSATSIVGSTGGIIILTDGADGSNNDPTGTANRKKSARGDLQKMRTAFIKKNRWTEGKMHALVEAEMLSEMFPAGDLTTATYLNQVTEEERRAGILFKAEGWNLMTRSSVINAATAGSIKAVGSVPINTDDKCSLFWNENSAEFSFGGVVPFFKYKDPNNYGDVFSFMTFSGGRAKRAGYEGIGLLKQAKTA